MGNHYHKKCLAVFFILSGKAEILVKDVRKKSSPVRFKLAPTQGALIYPYETHAICFLQKSTFLLMKSAKFDPKNNDLFLSPLL